MYMPYFISLYHLMVLIIVFVVKSDGMFYQEPLSVQDIELLFGEEECIQGTLSVSEMNSPIFQTISFIKSEEKLNENELSENLEDKSSMSMLNELAFFNNIRYQYILTREEGPPHQKRFNISLHLGDEEYSAEGTSIKKAQHIAAKLALQTTNYNHPHKKDTPNPIKAQKTHNPIQKLEDWVSKNLDTSVVYSFHGQFSKHHVNYYHDNMYSEPTFHHVTVKIGEMEFKGEGLTAETAKQNAAHNALQGILDVNGFCLLEEKRGSLLSGLFHTETENDSPISLIHEFASKSKLDISFDILKEEGLSHMKVFTFKCSIGEKFVSFGKGSSKKTAKKEAATNMVEQLKLHHQNVNCGRIFKKNKKKKQRSNKLIKSLEDIGPERESQISFPDDINPISKLMEIQQKNNDYQPIFTFLEEKGEPIKQFFIEVKVGNLAFVGSGPNKKSAKRKAAEGMLEILGYSRSSEGIRDSMVKQKKKEFLESRVTSQKKPLVSNIHLKSESFSRLDHNKESSHKKSDRSIKFKESKEFKAKLDHSEKSKNKIDQIPSDFKEPKSQFNYISRKLGFKFQFSDFPKSNNTGFVSLLSLITDPPKVCYGTGVSTSDSQENAMKGALKDLYKSHLTTISEILETLPRNSLPEDWSNVGEKIVQEEIITEI